MNLSDSAESESSLRETTVPQGAMILRPSAPTSENRPPRPSPPPHPPATETEEKAHSPRAARSHRIQSPDRAHSPRSDRAQRNRSPDRAHSPRPDRSHRNRSPKRAQTSEVFWNRSRISNFLNVESQNDRRVYLPAIDPRRLEVRRLRNQGRRERRRARYIERGGPRPPRAPRPTRTERITGQKE